MLPNTMTEMWATVGSTMASIMFVWTILQQYCPYNLRQFFDKYTSIITGYFNPYIQISFPEGSDDFWSKRSKAYATVETYLSSKASEKANRLKAELGKDSSKLVLSMDVHQRVTDEFRGVKIWWASKIVVKSTRSLYFPEQEKMSYNLTFHKKYRHMITESYLEHVMKEGKQIGVRNRQRKLYTNCPTEKWPSYRRSLWSSVVFEHPATFETMGMDPEKKQEIVDDLLNFSKSKDFYARIGKAWKRGYLLYGPPGTGKSTMIAAMANLLDYDVYDLELTAVKDNTELRKLLIETTSKSIIVIEDIDCSLDLTGQRTKKKKKSSEDDDQSAIPIKDVEEEEKSNKVTLSGLLNFVDGLWSACGGERLIVFTTNYLERLDPALIRRGRMDKHIELSYCSFEAFKVLAKKYLDLEIHQKFDTIQRLMGLTKITPADVAENLMPKSSSDDADKCLSNLIQALEQAKEEAAKKKAEEEEAAKKKDEDLKVKEEEAATKKAEEEEAAKKKDEDLKVKEEEAAKKKDEDSK
ncbi:hypothetical protein I3842_11G034900 [Carya illinoinensis]|uniref:AAA+ ATPase domain-containing protein n=1 Tax=Carya illinoinensis TaxID=32201 RepID=A0A922DLR2_CARIL|nr:hypothetical protein I3842_11G034900 [Carya illinoinensis]